MVTNEDRELFERLCVAMVGGLCSDPQLNPAVARWDLLVVGPAKTILTAIRAAESPGPDLSGQGRHFEEAAADMPSRCLSCRYRDESGDDGEHCGDCYRFSHWTPRQSTDELSALRAKLAEAESRVDALEKDLAEEQRSVLRAWAAHSHCRMRLDAACKECDAAESLIHALVDERVKRRDSYRLQYAAWESEHKLATSAERALTRIREIFRTAQADWEREAAAEPKPRRVLPVGHEPERLMPGMVVECLDYGPRRLTSEVVNGEIRDALGKWWFVDRNDARMATRYDIRLAAPFEVPND